MKASLISSLGITLLASRGVQAQGAAWAQCGGIGWTGATSCVSGYYCSYSNPYYSQCIPGTASTTRASTTTPSATTLKTSTTKSTSAGPTSTGGTKYWFSFGDSYTSTGFNSNGNQPTLQNPLGNPNYPGTTTSNGPNWIDVLTTKYNKAPTLTYNLAISGASIDNSIVNANNVPAVTDQVNTWMSKYSSKPSSAPWQSGNTMFSVFIGINDINKAYSQSNINSLIDTLLTAEFNLMSKIYNTGGRNFLFFSVPPVDRSPLIAPNTGWASAEKPVIATWNSKLQTYISNFKSSHSGVNTFFVDANAQFNMVLNNPTAYGLSSDIKSYGTNQQLFWADVLHPNTVMHGILAQEVARVANAGGFW